MGNDRAPAPAPYVFISYASADRGRMLAVVAALREAGVSCWIDQHGIEGGANWGLRIAEAIEGCAAFVLLSSAASLASRNVRQEIGLAWKYARPYLPLLLDRTPVPKEIEYFLEMSQWVEVLDALVATGALAVLDGRLTDAARLQSAADRHLRHRGAATSQFPTLEAEARAAVEAALPTEVLDRCRADGADWTLDEAVAATRSLATGVRREQHAEGQMP